MEVDAKLINKIMVSFDPANDKPKRKPFPCRIKIDGVIVKMRSGKSIWNSIGHAKSALRNHVGDILYREYHYTNRPNKDEVFKQVLAKCEFIHWTEGQA